jgi:hypothetical protein
MNVKFAKRRADREGVELPFESENPTTDYDQHIHKIIQEKSESIPKLGSIELLEKYYNKYKDDPNYLITYSNNPVVATNYTSYAIGEYKTPPGYYAYPLKELGDKTTDFAKHYKYLILTKITTDKVLNLGKYSKSKFKNDLKQLATFVDPQVVKESVSTNIQYTIFNISKKLKSIFKQSTLYMNLGYNVIIDPGLGLLHQNEPRQTVIFTPRSDLDLIGIFPVIKSIDHINQIKKFQSLPATEQIEYIKRDLKLAGYINNPSEDLLLQIVRNDGWAISELINNGFNVSKKVLLAAVNSKPAAIEAIQNPDEDVQLMAVDTDPFAIMFITPQHSITPRVLELYKSKTYEDYTFPIDIKSIGNPTEEQQLEALIMNPWTIKDIINKGIKPSEAVQIRALEGDPSLIRFIKNPSENVQLTAVTLDGMVIEHILDKNINPSKNVQLAAVDRNVRAVAFVSEEVQISTVKKNPKAIKFIKSPSEAVQIAAIQIDPYVIDYINPQSAITSKVRKLHKSLISVLSIFFTESKNKHLYNFSKIAGKYFYLYKLSKLFAQKA